MQTHLVHAADVLGQNPFINCPFDSPGIEIVERDDDTGRKLGDTVWFDLHRGKTLTGTIVAIGKNARTPEGWQSTAFILRRGQALTVKAARNVRTYVRH